jgi:hypothetical protein
MWLQLSQDREQTAGAVRYQREVKWCGFLQRSSPAESGVLKAA